MQRRRENRTKACVSEQKELYWGILCSDAVKTGKKTASRKQTALFDILTCSDAGKSIEIPASAIVLYHSLQLCCHKLTCYTSIPQFLVLPGSIIKTQRFRVWLYTNQSILCTKRKLEFKCKSRGVETCLHSRGAALNALELEFTLRLQYLNW